MDDTTAVDEWMSFFRDAGIPPDVSVSYASSFCQNRIRLNMVLELNRDLLKELGVTLIGDAIAILRHAKSFHEQNVRQKIFNLMSSEGQKPLEFRKKQISTADMASITNSKRFDGDISSHVASPVENNNSGITVACRNGNNQEGVRIRQQSTQNSLRSFGMSTTRPATAAPSQMENVAENISVGTLQREELQLCEALTPALGEADTTEEMSAQHSASRNQSERFLMREPVQSTSTLPLRQATVPSRVSEANYICRRNRGLKRFTQQCIYTKIPSKSQQPTEKGVTSRACQSPMPRIESNVLQDAPDEILQTQSIKQKRSSSYYGSREPELFDPGIDIQSVGTRVARQPVYETQGTTENVHSERLKLCHESHTSLPLQPPVQPQTSNAVSSQANALNHLQLQNEKMMMQCNPARSCSRAKFILATGKKINKKFELLHSHPRMSYMISVPHSSECNQGHEVQRPPSSIAVSSCSNKSILKETENREKVERAQTVLESDNGACVSQNGSETEIIDAGGGLLKEELSSLSDLNTERPAVRWDKHQLSKPVVRPSDSCVYEDFSSHTSNDSDNYAKNNLQHERVPGQIFSRLGVKVELVSVDNNVCNTAVKNDALRICRFGSNVKYKINKSKKHKNLSNKLAKIMAAKQLPKNKLLKRKFVFTALQKDSTTGRQNIVSDQTQQEITSVDVGQPKLRGILKPQTITSKQQEDMEVQEEEQPQRMTANLLLESVTRSSATDLGMVSDTVHFEENSLSNNSTKSDDVEYMYQNTDNFCSDNEQQEEFGRAPISGICKTVRFGPVCVKEFEKNVLPSSVKTTKNSRPPIFRRLGARRKEI